MCVKPRVSCSAQQKKRALIGSRQTGQALVETVVGALVLVPLVLLIIWLGKVQSLRQAVISASRLAAFECTVRPQECSDRTAQGRLADEMRRRVFSRVDAPVLSLDGTEDTATPGQRNALWVNRANQPLLERFSDVGLRVDPEPFDAGSSLAQARSGSLVSGGSDWLVEHAGPGRFGLEISSGMFDAKVQANMSVSTPFSSFQSQLDSIPLRIKAHTAILTDAWNADGPHGIQPASVQSRVRAGQVTSAAHDASVDARYLPVRGFIELMNRIGFEPKGGAFRYHQLDVSIVPVDRQPQSNDPVSYRSSSALGSSQ